MGMNLKTKTKSKSKSKSLLFGASWVLLATMRLLAQEEKTEQNPDEQAFKDLVMGKAIYIAIPQYPKEAVKRRINTTVKVNIVIDPAGNIVRAKARTGDPIFHPSAEAAALQSKFSPTTVEGKAVEASSAISFNFLFSEDWEGVGDDVARLEWGTLRVGPGNLTGGLDWEGFESERNEFNILAVDPNVPNRKERVNRLRDSIAEKLTSWYPLEAWLFSLGKLSAKLRRTAEMTGGEELFVSHFKLFKPLIDSAPSGISRERLQTLMKIAEDLSKSEMNISDRAKFVQALIEDYNQRSKGLQ